MKKFSSVDLTPRQDTPPDPYAPIKVRMMQGLERSDEVRKAVEVWITSFRGGITKEAYQRQIKRLDFDDNTALAQLKRAIGRRVIPLPPPPQKPSLDKPLLEKMVEDQYVAVYGRGFRTAIREAIPQLRACGVLYILEVERLCTEFVNYDNKGCAPRMIQDAIEADFLIVVGLEMPIHLEWHIREAIERIGRLREEQKRPIISTWCRFNDCNSFFERFKIYHVK